MFCANVPVGHNIGYKNYDPSHPCRKVCTSLHQLKLTTKAFYQCWDKYAKPYSGAITYAPWANRGAETSYYQRPLPNFLRGPTNTLFHQQQQGQPQFFQPPPPPPPQQQFQRGYGYGHGPPPGAVVVQPGDPRIGGKTCWNCYGSGQVSIFLFDTDRCRTCNGMGRIL